MPFKDNLLLPWAIKKPNEVLLDISRAARWFADKRCISALRGPEAGWSWLLPLLDGAGGVWPLLCCFRRFFCRSSSWKGTFLIISMQSFLHKRGRVVLAFTKPQLFRVKAKIIRSYTFGVSWMTVNINNRYNLLPLLLNLGCLNIYD